MYLGRTILNKEFSLLSFSLTFNHSLISRSHTDFENDLTESNMTEEEVAISKVSCSAYVIQPQAEKAVHRSVFIKAFYVKCSL